MFVVPSQCPIIVMTIPKNIVNFVPGTDKTGETRLRETSSSTYLASMPASSVRLPDARFRRCSSCCSRLRSARDASSMVPLSSSYSIKSSKSISPYSSSSSLPRSSSHIFWISCTCGRVPSLSISSSDDSTTARRREDVVGGESETRPRLNRVRRFFLNDPPVFSANNSKSSSSNSSSSSSPAVFSAERI